nr:hypothetical protein CoNPh37_CDS0146 [Staphylococcus phage S-CoN_Ph37]
MITLAKMDKELKYKLQNFPLVQYNMLEHTVFDDF